MLSLHSRLLYLVALLRFWVSLLFDYLVARYRDAFWPKADISKVPLDSLYEVCIRLDPKSILMLSQTCSSLSYLCGARVAIEALKDHSYYHFRYTYHNRTSYLHPVRTTRGVSDMIGSGIGSCSNRFLILLREKCDVIQGIDYGDYTPIAQPDDDSFDSTAELSDEDDFIYYPGFSDDE